jgi:hypothetical protein
MQDLAGSCREVCGIAALDFQWFVFLTRCSYLAALLFLKNLLRYWINAELMLVIYISIDRILASHPKCKANFPFLENPCRKN